MPIGTPHLVPHIPFPEQLPLKVTPTLQTMLQESLQTRHHATVHTFQCHKCQDVHTTTGWGYTNFYCKLPFRNTAIHPLLTVPGVPMLTINEKKHLLKCGLAICILFVSCCMILFYWQERGMTSFKLSLSSKKNSKLGAARI